ncbi:hypothetical protein JGU66_15075 [Myxococcaceae bacterium JPH2]|nr:hypothetical protein [Myxococcaceae bacterium JPH2]
MAVGVAEAGDTAFFFGPTEVRVYRPDDDNAWAASDAVAVLAPYGVRPDAALVLRPWAEKRTQSGSHELEDAKGRTVGHAASEDVTYVGHVEVVHPASQQLVLEVSAEAAVNPFAERADEGADPAPELTAMMELLTREALRALGGALQQPRVPAPALGRVAWVPWEALDLTQELSQRDALDAEVLRHQRLRFANPGEEDTMLNALQSAPAGLLVREGPTSGKLAPGDIVLTLDGRPALPQALARARLAPVPVEARVKRASGATVPVLLP